jgi:hypothetical protein
MSAKSELNALRGLVRRINNKIFGYKKRGRNVNRRTKRTISKR